MRSAAIALFASIVLSATPAAAERRWYGWQVLVGDGAAIATSVPFFATTDHSGLGFVNLFAGYLIVAPSVHLVHENYAGAGGSVALRVLTPIVIGVAAGYLRCELGGPRSWDLDCPEFGARASLFGMTVASAIDSAALSYGEPMRRRRAPSVAPTFALSQTSLNFGLRGVF